MPAASFGLNELIEAAEACGCRSMLFGEHTPTPKLVVFLPELELAANNTKAPACIVGGMTLLWTIDPKTQCTLSREPVIGQLHTHLAHPHMSQHSVFDGHMFCRGSNTKLMSVAAKSGEAIDMIGASIVTVKDYYAGSSYRRAASTIPITSDYGTACRCLGGQRTCAGCPSSGPMIVTEHGYANETGVVPCSGCKKTVSGNTVWIDEMPYCDSCAVVYEGKGYLRSSCVRAAVNGGILYVPQERVISCTKCSKTHGIAGVTEGYVRVCPMAGCEARSRGVS